jgi:hypothetical protein
MGSRINIALVGLLNTPNIEVKLMTEELNDGEDNPGGHNTRLSTAVVVFRPVSSKQEDLVFSFDYHVHQGRIELSADFNWFRYDDSAPHKKLLRMLYEHSVSFTVHH